MLTADKGAGEMFFMNAAYRVERGKEEREPDSLVSAEISESLTITDENLSDMCKQWLDKR